MRTWTLNMKISIESGNPEIGVQNAVAAMSGDTSGQLSSIEQVAIGGGLILIPSHSG
jgi:hypothetical protein